MKGDEWFQDRAEGLYEAPDEDLWTHRDTLVEGGIIACREGWNVERVVANVNVLLKVAGDIGPVLVAASDVENQDLAPFDGSHLVHAGGNPTVSNDDTDDRFTVRIPLESQE